MKKRYSATAILQSGVADETLGLKSYGGSVDTWIYAPHRVADRNNAHVNYGTVDHISIGKYALISRGLLRFDLEGVSKGAKVGSAVLQLYMFAKRKPSGIEAYDVLKPWGAGRGTGSRWTKPAVVDGEASWNCYQHPSKWDGSGCGAAGKDRSEKPVGQGAAISEGKGWVTVELDPKLVQRWIDEPSSNRGIMLKDKGEGNGSECKYRSNEFEDAGMRPRLVVGFAGGVRSARSASKSSTARRSTSTTRSARSSLKAEPKKEKPLPEGFGRIILTSGEVIVAKDIRPSRSGVSYVGRDGRRRNVSLRKVRKIEQPK